MSKVYWDISKKELLLVRRIAKRMAKKAKEIGIKNFDRTSCEMDIVACHANGNPLDLEKLLNADYFNLFHDVNGIRNHIDRKTGKLKDCFVPRCSV